MKTNCPICDAICNPDEDNFVLYQNPTDGSDIVVCTTCKTQYDKIMNSMDVTEVKEAVNYFYFHQSEIKDANLSDFISEVIASAAESVKETEAKQEEKETNSQSKDYFQTMEDSKSSSVQNPWSFAVRLLCVLAIIGGIIGGIALGNANYRIGVFSGCIIGLFVAAVSCVPLFMFASLADDVAAIRANMKK